MDKPPVHRVVIIGGGFGGLYAAQCLKKAPVEVVLVDRRNFHLFQPLLYQVATGTLGAGDIGAPLRVMLRHQRNVQVLLAEVTGIDPASRQVILADGKLSYDSLILAAGSSTHYFDHPEWRALALGLKSIEDAAAIRTRVLRAFEAAERETDPAEIKKWLTFVIVGAGPTGVELAGALAELARKTLRQDFRKICPELAQIILISSKKHVLPTYPSSLSIKAEEALQKLGVIIREEARVSGLEADAVLIGEGNQAERLETRTVLWAAGVRPSSLAQKVAGATGSALDKRGRMVVEPDMSVTGHPEIFVIGDMAAYKTASGDTLPGVAPVAMQEGRFVAQVIRNRLCEKAPPVFHYRDYGTLATIGRAAAVVDLQWLRFSGLPAWLFWLTVHLFYLADFEDKVLVLLQWASSYLTWNRSNLLMTASQALPRPEHLFTDKK